MGSWLFNFIMSFTFQDHCPYNFNFRIRVRNAPAHQISFMIVGPTLTCWGRVAKNKIWGVRSQTSSAELELHLRFKRYKDFPLTLCKLCHRWFQTSYIEANKAFFTVDEESLD